MMISSNASGWVGRESLSVSVQQSGQVTNVDGFLGTDSVHLRQDERSISGDISGFQGYSRVNLSVQKYPNGSRLSGWVGNNNFYLDDRTRPNGEHWMTGNLGRVNINLTRRDRENNSSIQGSLTNPGSLSENVSVNLSGSVPTQMEALYPALSYLGPAMRLALAG